MPTYTDTNGIIWNFTVDVNNNATIGTGVDATATESGTALSGDIVIPGTVTDNSTSTEYTVKKIGIYAFRNCSSLTSVTIPDSVTTIGDNAFQGCSELTSVTIGNSVETIGQSAFRSCSSLTSVTIPDTVETIGDNAFNRCSSLTSVTIGNSVTTIGTSCFFLCSRLESVIIGDSVETIGDNAFSVCSSLTSVNIPYSLISIGSEAFKGCSSLTSVTIPALVTSIGNNAFNNSGLSTVVIADQQVISETIFSSPDTSVSFYGISVTTQTPIQPPAAPICFPKGTPVTTDQGIIAIEKLNTDKHTIRGKEIVAITQSKPLQKHIVCFDKDALSKNVPSQETLCSMEHKVFYKGEMMKARDIVDVCENVIFVPYNGETLFNVLLKKDDKMMINNLICETLHPKNIMAKISTMKDGQKKNKAIRELTKIIKENNIPEYQKLYASL